MVKMHPFSSLKTLSSFFLAFSRYVRSVLGVAAMDTDQYYCNVSVKVESSFGPFDKTDV